MTLSLVLIAWLIMIINEVIIRVVKTRRPDSTGKGWRIAGFICLCCFFLGLHEKSSGILSELEFLGTSFLLIFLYVCTGRAVNFGRSEDTE